MQQRCTDETNFLCEYSFIAQHALLLATSCTRILYSIAITLSLYSALLSRLVENSQVIRGSQLLSSPDFGRLLCINYHLIYSLQITRIILH